MQTDRPEDRASARLNQLQDQPLTRQSGERIGTELEKLQLAPAPLWNQLIERVHQTFPGKLTYDMNWSSLYFQTPSWMRNPLLTAVGVSVYIPLTDTPQRLDPAILPGLWQEKMGKLLDSLAIQLTRQVFISKIGYRDSAYALYRPWERDAQAQAGPAYYRRLLLGMVCTVV